VRVRLKTAVISELPPPEATPLATPLVEVPFFADVPISPSVEPPQKTRRTPLEVALENPRSLRKAINAKCWVCCGAGQDPGTRKQIGRCVVTACPLHALRPYQHHQDDDADD
jgi:hypothetical protein